MSDSIVINGHYEVLEWEDEDVCPFSHVFDDFISPKSSFSLNRIPWNPPTDIYETQDTIVVKMELSGVRVEHIKVSVQNNILTVEGERFEDSPVKKKKYHLMEIHYGAFHRAFKLTREISRNEIDANFKNGFLVINIPKRLGAPEPIDIFE